MRREQDFLLHLPLRYEDLTHLSPIAGLRVGDVAQVEGTVERAEVIGRPRRSLVVSLRGDDGAEITLRFIHFYGSQQRQLAGGRRLRAAGEVRGGLFGLEMIHPQYRLVTADTPLPERLTPVYPTVSGVSQHAIRTAVAAALRTHPPAETVDEAVRTALGLPGIAESLGLLHQPAAGTDIDALVERRHPAWLRVFFDELLAQQLALLRARRKRRHERAPVLAELSRAAALLAGLPFTLTSGQARAWREISADLASAAPMNRLLQGDVGSGKTVVSALAAAQCVGSGFQAVLMAPTEILAEQHAVKLAPVLARIGIRSALLTGSMGEAAKRALRAAIAAGEVEFVVGTHAVIEQGVVWRRLGLAIVDEQHRFGVAQRLRLRSRGEGETSDLNLPHQLMMSATPIPRTLAMSYYADLDVSVIDELPPGRQPIRTRLVAESRRDEVIERVRQAVAAGRQVYWVCPLIDDATGDAGSAPEGSVVHPVSTSGEDLKAAVVTHAELASAISSARVGLVHGRLPAAEKQATMEAFVAGELDVLVATTVIEVGVDVPNASLMVIEHAERFGLAQLHQLRGRVGRGSARSECVLLFRAPLSVTAKERLRAMYETQDGFEISRRDLRLRGPGEFLGARQSGLPLLRYADLERDARLLEAAREAAARMLVDDAGTVEAHLQRWYGGREDYLLA